MRKVRGMSAGERLMALLSERAGEILERETVNDGCIYLYDTGGYWTAFEKSAYRLTRMCRRCEVAPMLLRGFPFPVVVASVLHDDLSRVCGVRVVSAASDFRAICSGGDDAAGFAEWHRRTAGAMIEYAALMEKQ